MVTVYNVVSEVALTLYCFIYNLYTSR